MRDADETRRAGRQGAMSVMGRKKEGEKRGSRGVCKIGRQFSSVFNLVGVRGRKEVGPGVEERWACKTEEPLSWCVGMVCTAKISCCGSQWRAADFAPASGARM